MTLLSGVVLAQAATRFAGVNLALGRARPGAGVTVGLAHSAPTDDSPLQTLIAAADQDLYRRRRARSTTGR